MLHQVVDMPEKAFNKIPDIVFRLRFAMLNETISIPAKENGIRQSISIKGNC